MTSRNLSLSLIVVAIVGIAYSIRSRDTLGLSRYHASDLQLASVAEPSRVVFIGDSIVDFWNLKTSFPGAAYVNRGISRQTTGQILGRFSQDVVALRPKAVVVLAGTNDIAKHVPLAETESNLAAMVDMAHRNGIGVYFISILPVSSKIARTRAPAEIAKLNSWLREFTKGDGLIDCWPTMADSNGFLRGELSNDGLHPNAAGYSVMAASVQRALAVER